MGAVVVGPGISGSLCVRAGSGAVHFLRMRVAPAVLHQGPEEGIHVVCVFRGHACVCVDRLAGHGAGAPQAAHAACRRNPTRAVRPKLGAVRVQLGEECSAAVGPDLLQRTAGLGVRVWSLK